MARLIKRLESSCVFCGGESRVETVQWIVACTTCSAEVPDTIPFYSECDFLRSAYRMRCGAFGATEGHAAFFKNTEGSETPVENKKSRELTEEEKLKLKILNSKFLSDDEKRGKLPNIRKLKKSRVESEYEQREAE